MVMDVTIRVVWWERKIIGWEEAWENLEDKSVLYCCSVPTHVCKTTSSFVADFRFALSTCCASIKSKTSERESNINNL